MDKYNSDQIKASKYIVIDDNVFFHKKYKSYEEKRILN